MTSIIIPCYGQLEFTRLCVYRVFATTDVPFELVFLDLCSIDGTKDFIDGVRAVLPNRVQLLGRVNRDDMHQVFEVVASKARGADLIFLSNDTIVTKHWLRRLLGLANHNADIGMVGAMSNYSSASQLVPNPAYTLRIPAYKPWENRTAPELSSELFSQLDEFAEKWSSATLGRWIEPEVLDGFCFLIKRSALDAAGGLLSVTNNLAGGLRLSLVDAHLLSQRVRLGGYRIACASVLAQRNLEFLERTETNSEGHSYT